MKNTGFFDQEDILRRLRLGVIPEYDLKNDDLQSTWAYISDLEELYKKYLTNYNRDGSYYRIMNDLMRILLNQYNKRQREIKLNAESIELISKAAYFCDIGEMFISDKRLQSMGGNTDFHDLEKNHTLFGANLIRLNRAKSCEYFVEICSSMCLHHHERWAGKGYPDRLIDEFEQLRSKFYGDKARPVKFVIRRLVNDSPGLVNPKISAVLEDCEPQFIDYFMKKVV